MTDRTAAQSGSSGIVQVTPDLASLEGTGTFPRRKEQVGAGSEKAAQSVQMENSSSSARNSRPIPRNFVWRLHGGRSSSSTNLTETLTEGGDRGEMAVDVPALRDSFDPWGQHEKEEDDGRCNGCSKIAKARAAAAAQHAVQSAPSSPHGEQTPSFANVQIAFPILAVTCPPCRGDGGRFILQLGTPPRHHPPSPPSLSTFPARPSSAGS
jgi:hypothetical protein